MELKWSNLTSGCHEQELRPHEVIVSLGVTGEEQYPQLNFSKLLELFETSQARKLIFGLQVSNIDKHKANRRRRDVTR